MFLTTREVPAAPMGVWLTYVIVRRLLHSQMSRRGVKQRKCVMKKIPKVTYQTVEQLELRIKAREADAARLPAGEPRQSVLKEIAQLRAYAGAKQWLSEPLSKQQPQRSASLQRPGGRGASARLV
jgi:hypothetical protein